MLRPTKLQGEDFLNTLLSDSVSGSPLWSPSPSDSGISEDPHSDQMDSPKRPESPPTEPHFLPPQPHTRAALDTDFSINISRTYMAHISTESIQIYRAFHVIYDISDTEKMCYVMLDV